MPRIQITVEQVTTTKKLVKGDWAVLNVSYGNDGKISDDTRGYAPDQEKDVVEVKEIYKQDIETEAPEKILQAIIRAANGI